MKREKNKKKKDIDKILTIVLLICVILCLIFGVVLYFNGIEKIIPIILIFVSSFVSAIFIFFLSKDTIAMKKKREQKVSRKINA